MSSFLRPLSPLPPSSSSSSRRASASFPIGQENDALSSNSRPTTPVIATSGAMSSSFAALKASPMSTSPPSTSFDLVSSPLSMPSSSNLQQAPLPPPQSRRPRREVELDVSLPSAQSLGLFASSESPAETLTVHPSPTSGSAPPSDDEEEGEEEVEVVEEEEEEDASERVARELAESEELARQLMAEEAMASYALSANYLRDNASSFDAADLAALQAAMMDEDPNAPPNAAGDEDAEGEGEEGEDSGGLSYDALLQLGERIGDVKSERWALVAASVIARLPRLAFDAGKAVTNDSEAKCLVCLTTYEEGETLTALPCRHVFHEECAEGWLLRKDCCPYCRQGIVQEKKEE